MTRHKLKVAIVCDWLTTMGGAERVVLELHRMFPDAPIYTSSYAPNRMPLLQMLMCVLVSSRNYLFRINISCGQCLEDIISAIYVSRITI